MDYLNPEANKLFDQWTFDAYKQAVGDELGKTVLGFRGDEPGFGFGPWSPVLLAEFQKRKGYDLRPYLATITSINIGGGRGAAAPASVNLDESHRVFADYYDVWSDLFGENFFGMRSQMVRRQPCRDADAHRERGNPAAAGQFADGDFFKCMRGIQVPGVDTIWHQIWHDVVADFPKLASSATHLNGHPRAMTEAFAAYNPVPDIKEAGWILNHLMVNGINRIEYMGMGGPGTGRRAFTATRAFPPSPPTSTAYATCSAKADPPRKSASISLRPVSGSTTPPRTPPSSPSSTNFSSISATSTTWMNTRCRNRSSCRAMN